MLDTMAETTTTATVPLQAIWTDPFNTVSSEGNQQGTVQQIVRKLGQNIVDKANMNFALKPPLQLDDIILEYHPTGNTFLSLTLS